MSIKDIKWLRSETGASLTDCKKALNEAGTDLEKAREIAMQLQSLRAEADDALAERKQTEMEMASSVRKQAQRKQAQHQAALRRAEQEAKWAKSAAQLNARIEQINQSKEELTNEEAQIDRPNLTRTMTIVQTLEVGYKSSAGRFEGRIVS